jgi:hypothetical protein
MTRGIWSTDSDEWFYRLLHNLPNLLTEFTSKNHNFSLVIYAALCSLAMSHSKNWTVFAFRWSGVRKFYLRMTCDTPEVELLDSKNPKKR